MPFNSDRSAPALKALMPPVSNTPTVLVPASGAASDPVASAESNTASI